MSFVRWCGFAALVSLIPSAAIAQQVAPPDPPPLTVYPQAVSRELATPLPTVGQADGVHRPLVDPTGITLAELEAMATQCNPTLAQAASRVESARGRWVQAGLYPNPTAGYTGAEIGNEGRAGQQGGFVGQEIVTAGKLRLSQSVVEQEIRQAQWDWHSQRQRVLTDVRRGFYDALVAQHAVELTEQLLRIGEEGVRSTETLMRAKEVARADVLQAQIEADTARILLQRARNRHQAAWRNLAAVVGTPDMPPSPLAGEPSDGLSVLTWEDTYNRLLAESPQLAAAHAGVARAKAILSRECAQRVPNVDVMTAVQYDNATQDTWATVQAGIPVPLFNRNQGNIHRAQADVATAQRDVERVQLELRQRLAAAFEQYTTARYEVEKYQRDILPNARAALDMTTKGYQAGEYRYLFLLTAQRTYFQTSLTYLDSLRELRAAATAIEGNLLGGSLQASDGDRP